MKMLSLIHHPQGAKRLGELLIENLTSGQWHTFRAAVAFAKRSGVKDLVEPLMEFVSRGSVRISVGIDQRGTSAEAVENLLAALNPAGELWIFHDEERTFHPKLYLFENDDAAECIIGSGNLTGGGLLNNHEAHVQLRLEKRNPEAREFLSDVTKLLDAWVDSSKGTALRVTAKIIKDLNTRGLLPTEAEINQLKSLSQEATQGSKLFPSVPVKPTPLLQTVEKAKKVTGRTIAGTSGDLYAGNSDACDFALRQLRDLLEQAGYKVIKKHEGESTLRVYPVKYRQYPLLNPRFVTTAAHLDEALDRECIDFTVLSKGDGTVLDQQLRTFRSTQECEFVPVCVERTDGYYHHGDFILPLTFAGKGTISEINFTSLRKPLARILELLKASKARD